MLFGWEGSHPYVFFEGREYEKVYNWRLDHSCCGAAPGISYG